MNYVAQLGQDRFVDQYLKGMKSGYFVDLGSADFKQFNNTHYFETQLDWKGIAVEFDSKYSPSWVNRPNTKYLCEDATLIDYQKLFDEFGMPKMIDYLSIDLEPPELTLECLKQVLKSDYEYKIITFEVDFYRTPVVLNESRKLFSERGYILVGEIFENKNHIDDVWVHPSIHDTTFKI